MDKRQQNLRTGNSYLVSSMKPNARLGGDGNMFNNGKIFIN